MEYNVCVFIKILLFSIKTKTVRHFTKKVPLNKLFLPNLVNRF